MAEQARYSFLLLAVLADQTPNTTQSSPVFDITPKPVETPDVSDRKWFLVWENVTQLNAGTVDGKAYTTVSGKTSDGQNVRLKSAELTNGSMTQLAAADANTTQIKDPNLLAQRIFVTLGGAGGAAVKAGAKVWLVSNVDFSCNATA